MFICQIAPLVVQASVITFVGFPPLWGGLDTSATFTASIGILFQLCRWEKSRSPFNKAAFEINASARRNTEAGFKLGSPPGGGSRLCIFGTFGKGCR